MKPLVAEDQDGATLQNLGRASLQIIHDIKNQLNGLKLYATFLRKRMEKSEQRNDERETVVKLISGLDRAAGDLNVLVQYGRPIELHRQQQIDLQKLMRGVLSSLGNGATGIDIANDTVVPALIGEFDPTALSDALRDISLGAAKTRQNGTSLDINFHVAEPGVAVIEWHGSYFENGDPFQSFRGSEGIRMSLAAKIIEAHGGVAEYETNLLRVRLPLT